MSDPRMQEVADRAQSAARPAEFAELARRGRRRRTRGVLAAGAVTALVLGGTALGVHTAFDDSSAPANPVSPVPTSGQTSQSEHTTRVTPRQQLTAEQVVDDPHAALVGVAVATDDHDVRASEWSVCSDDACASRLWAVAVSADAFQHAAYALVAEPTALTWTGGDTFVVSTRDGTLSRIDSSGNSYPLAISEEVGPLSTDETLVIDGRDPATP